MSSSQLRIMYSLPLSLPAGDRSLKSLRDWCVIPQRSMAHWFHLLGLFDSTFLVAFIFRLSHLESFAEIFFPATRDLRELRAFRPIPHNDGYKYLRCRAARHPYGFTGKPSALYLDDIPLVLPFETQSTRREITSGDSGIFRRSKSVQTTAHSFL